MAGFNFNVGGFNIGGGGGGSAGAAAGKGCGGGCGAVFGVILGIVLVPVGFYLAYHAEARLVDHGKIFESITMAQPDTAKGMEGQMVKIQGQPQGDFLEPEEWDGQALYYYKEIEEYEKDTDSDGNVEYEWNTESTDQKWVQSFSIGGVEIKPDGANPVGEDEVYSAYQKKFETAFHTGTDPGSPEVGDQRKTVDVLDAAKTTIVVGNMSGGTIQGGESFVVSTQNEQQTLQTLKTEYRMAKWAMRAGAVFCIFFGILAIFGPLTTLVGYIPLVGDSLGCAFAGLAFVFALVSVTVVTLFIKAFWFLVALVVIGVAVLVYRGITTPREGPGGGEGGGPDQPVPPTQPTPAGTDESQAGTSSTLPPGASAGVPRPSEAPEPVEPAEDVGPAPPPETPAEREATVESEFMRPAEPSEAEPEAEETSAAPVESAFMRPAEPSEEASEAEDAPNFCSNCGAELEPGSKFCQQCGEKVD